MGNVELFHTDDTWGCRKAPTRRLRLDNAFGVFIPNSKGQPYLPGGGLASFVEKWHVLLIERRNKGGKVNDYAGPTGGLMIDAREGDVEAKLNQLVDLLRARYSFGYRPPRSTIDGKFRQIKIKVSREVEKREGKIVIVTRKGYSRRGCPQ